MKRFLSHSKQYKHLISLLPSASQNVANFVGKVTQSHDTSDWILDNGASEHLTYDAPFLSHMKTTSYSLPVRLPNRKTVHVHSVGQIKLLDMVLDHVLHIPFFKCNLFSVRRLTKALQCLVTFFPSFCV